MKLLTLERVFWLAAIVALLILLKRCGSGRETAERRAQVADSLRTATEQDRAKEAVKSWEYHNNQQQAQYEARQADTAKRKALAQVSRLQALIRGQNPPDDPTVVVMTDSLCCEYGRQLADRVDSLNRADTAKDRASNEQLTLATGEIIRISNALDREQARYDLLDSLNTAALIECRPRTSVWLGAEAQAGPIWNAGLYGRLVTKRDKEYTIGGGRQPAGWYVKMGLGIKIKLRK